jgi:predicted dehydrogenase
MPAVALIGTGFVADLYMRSMKTFPEIKVIGAHDRNINRLETFSNYWNIPSHKSISSLIETARQGNAIILNLTNPESHYDVSRFCLENGLHVYSEKPLATNIEHAFDLIRISEKNKLFIASAPCSSLSETAQTIWKAIRDNEIGRPLLVYAELDDDFVPKAPYAKWISESGAPWPAEDEFTQGCTVEHAGYYLSWLMALFGPIRAVSAASAQVISYPPNIDKPAPDYSCATLFFESGTIARLTCSIVAPHDHSLRIIGDNGIIEVNECWNNSAPVRVRRRFVIRRKLVNSPLTSTVRLRQPTHPKVKRQGAAAMNFALGPAEMLEAIGAGRKPRLSNDFALHLTEVTLRIQESRDSGQTHHIQSRFEQPAPMPWSEFRK